MGRWGRHSSTRMYTYMYCICTDGSTTIYIYTPIDETIYTYCTCTDGSTTILCTGREAAEAFCVEHKTALANLAAGTYWLHVMHTTTYTYIPNRLLVSGYIVHLSRTRPTYRARRRRVLARVVPALALDAGAGHGGGSHGAALRGGGRCEGGSQSQWEPARRGGGRRSQAVAPACASYGCPCRGRQAATVVVAPAPH